MTPLPLFLLHLRTVISRLSSAVYVGEAHLCLRLPAARDGCDQRASSSPPETCRLSSLSLNTLLRAVLCCIQPWQETQTMAHSAIAIPKSQVFRDTPSVSLLPLNSPVTLFCQLTDAFPLPSFPRRRSVWNARVRVSEAQSDRMRDQIPP